MKLNKKLYRLTQLDRKVQNLPSIKVYSRAKDSNHFVRRLQQRAISWNMIKLAIAHGEFQYHSHAKTWTLLDKNLQFTPYRKYIDKLRGLRIIALNNSSQNILLLTTAYWSYDLKK
jgi:hypothetical protein